MPFYSRVWRELSISNFFEYLYAKSCFNYLILQINDVKKSPNYDIYYIRIHSWMCYCVTDVYYTWKHLKRLQMRKDQFLLSLALF